MDLTPARPAELKARLELCRAARATLCAALDLMG